MKAEIVEKVVSLRTSINSSINLALHQNTFPMITGIEIDNCSDEGLSSIELLDVMGAYAL